MRSCFLVGQEYHKKKSPLQIPYQLIKEVQEKLHEKIARHKAMPKGNSGAAWQELRSSFSKGTQGFLTSVIQGIRKRTSSSETI